MSKKSKSTVFEVNAYIHGRFKIQDGSTFADKMAYHYIHMNHKERRAKEAVYEKAKFKFKQDYLHVCKPNRMTHVQEVKYPYEQIERVYLFNDYPTIIAFCINKKTHWIALLFETKLKDDAERACRSVEDFHRRLGEDAGNNISRGIWMSRPSSYMEPPSDGDSQHSGSRPPSRAPTILYNGKPDSDSDDFPEDIDSPRLRGSRRSAERPVTYTEGVGQAHTPRMLLNLCYDHGPGERLQVENGRSRSRSRSPHHHDKKGKDNNRKVRILGRFSSPLQEPFSPNKAYDHLRTCLTNPSEASSVGDLRLMSDCIKLGALKNGHYDHHQLYRLWVFEDDPNTLVFGIVEHHLPMYMLLRFNTAEEKDEAIEILRRQMGQGRIPDSGDHHLSRMVTGNVYSGRSSLSGHSLEQMSRTIALPSEREVVEKQQRRASTSSSSSLSEIVATRRVGVHAERPASASASGSMTVDEEFKVLLASAHIEGEDKRIDAVVVEDHCMNRTTDSAMYFGEEEDDEKIYATVETRSHAVMKRSSTPSTRSSIKSERWKWVEEASYIDYKPGVGVVESDSGPIYMYCARQVRENDYRLF